MAALAAATPVQFSSSCAHRGTVSAKDNASFNPVNSASKLAAARNVAANAASPVQTLTNPMQSQELQSAFLELEGGGVGLLMGTRIPKDFFLAQGVGQTNAGGGIDPWETGSYDLALEDAGIMDFNIVPYTSVLPKEATEVKFQEAQKLFRHGAVLETIIAQMNGSQGDRISAGVGLAQVRRISDGQRLGGYAAEYKGHAKGEEVKRILREDIKGIFERRYTPDDHEIVEEKFVIQESEIEESYGTVLAAVCFVTYILPLYPAQS